MGTAKKSSSKPVEPPLHGNAPCQGNYWEQIADCQRLVHEMQVYQVEIDLVSEESELHSNGLQAWREETKRLQLEFYKAGEKVFGMAEGSEKHKVGIQCIESTLKLCHERFRLLIRGIAEKATE